MYTYKNSVIIEHNITKAYNLVSNIEAYPSFIPWIASAKKIYSSSNSPSQEHEGNVLQEKLSEEQPLEEHYLIEVDFKIVREKFSTRDIFYKEKKITIDLIEGPFSHLHCVWDFEKISDNLTKVDFFIEFDFKSKVLSLAFGKLFLLAQTKILNYFINKINNQE